MLASEIRELTDDDIRARLAELEEERFRLRFRGATETLENPLRLRFLRRDVARLKTILHERTLGAGAAPAGGGGGAAAPRPAAKRAGAKRAAGTQAAKKTTARKSAAKKGATKKSPAKKAAAKKAGTSTRAGSRAAKR
jgi:large subunit ribosomal protein L29